jgi:hypothetical protein
MRARESESKGADPVRVFLILAAILVAIGVVFWLTRSDPIADTPANATSTGSPDFSLTDEEAIARFEELDALKLRAYRTLDSSLLDSIFTSDSPSVDLVEKDFQRLQASGMKFRSGFDTQEVSVLSNDPLEIVIEQLVTVSPRIMDANGNNITRGGRQLQTVSWVLHREVDEWLVYETVVEEVKELN